MVSDLVALRLHAAQQILVARNLLPDYKKGCRRVPLQQAVQQAGGGVRPGAVVKGQGHIFWLLGEGLAHLLVQPAQNFYGDLRLSANVSGEIGLHRPGAARGQPGQQRRQKKRHSSSH